MNPRRFLITGYRTITPPQARFVMETLGRICRVYIELGTPVTIVEGRCPYGGVDRVAQQWAELTNGVTDEGHPAPWETHGKTAGRIRNAHMVSLGADLCIGFPAHGSVGTWDCIRKAADAGILCRIYPLPVE